MKSISDIANDGDKFDKALQLIDLTRAIFCSLVFVSVSPRGD
jgi:hypothetical protein